MKYNKYLIMLYMENYLMKLSKIITINSYFNLKNKPPSLIPSPTINLKLDLYIIFSKFTKEKNKHTVET